MSGKPSNYMQARMPMDYIVDGARFQRRRNAFLPFENVRQPGRQLESLGEAHLRRPVCAASRGNAKTV